MSTESIALLVLLLTTVQILIMPRNTQLGKEKRSDPNQTSRLCKGYLSKNKSDGVLHQMIWLPQSPDLNPIEMFWDVLDQ